VPLKSGSGTRLKILEAMSMGNPVVSTVIGAEGIVFEKAGQMLITDDAEDFARHISILLNNKEKFNNVRAEAYELVKSTYDWRTIGVKINESLENLLVIRNEVEAQ
jgi:polysaccharide biosynthesis protein PslH